MSNLAINFETLKAFTPFDNLQDKYLQQVAAKVSIKAYPKGTLIFKRGKVNNESYYLIEGDVDLVNSQFEITSLATGSEARRFPLNDTSPSQVSAVAKSEVKLLSVERDLLDLAMVWSQSVDIADGQRDDNTEQPGRPFSQPPGEPEVDWMSALLRSPLFTRVPPANIQQLFTRFEQLPVKAGDLVVKQDVPGDYFYVIERGRARVESKDGKVLVNLQAGQFFGEEALVGETTRNASVVMTTNGALMRLGKEDFQNLLQKPTVRFVEMDEVNQHRGGARALQILDVRLPVEFRFQHLKDALNIPLHRLRARFSSLNDKVIYVVTDDAGRRSDVAAHLLCQAGFDTYILKNSQLHYG